MSLLLLKTKDLSWQDHTMHVEVMLKPNQLLYKKHKMLETKYIQGREVFDQQLKTHIKDFAVGRKLAERHRGRLVSRKRELRQHRAQVDMKERQLRDTCRELERSKSNAVEKSETPSPIRQTRQRSRGVFVTEIDDEKISKLPSISQKSNKIKPSFRKSKPKQDKKSKKESESLGEKRYITLTTKTAGVNKATSPAASEQEIRNDPLIEKVKSFVEDIKEFNSRIPSHKESDHETFKFPKWRTVTTPLVAKRYTKFNVDMQMIQNAFDDLCKKHSKEELHKMIALAAKLKANVALARNQSLIPTIGVFKSSRAFKQLTQRCDNNELPRDEE